VNIISCGLKCNKTHPNLGRYDMLTQKQKFNGIQAARGVAAMLVVLHHAANHLKQDIGYLPLEGVFHFGRAGVDFFFVLSGFIIFFVHQKDLGRPKQLGRYIYKRFTRIYPIYWVAMCILLTVNILSGKHYSIPGFFWDASLMPGSKLETLGVAWTLRFEILFYLLFSLVIISFRVGVALLVVWVFTILAYSLGFMLKPENPFMGLFVSAWNFEFILGLFSGFYLSRYRLPIPMVLLLLSILGFLVVGMYENIDALDGTRPYARLPYGFLSLIILMSLVECERSGCLRVPNIMVLIGESSYSIYLMHLLFIGVTYKVMMFVGVLNDIPVWIIYSLLFVCAVAGGVVFFLAIERPILKASYALANMSVARKSN